MTTYYVATLSSYVLVDAADEADARAQGGIALRGLLGPNRPITIRTIRLATADEIEFQKWSDETMAREQA